MAYAIEWKNVFGKRVIYPEKVWKSKSTAEKNAIKLAYKRLQHGTLMKEIKIIKV